MSPGRIGTGTLGRADLGTYSPGRTENLRKPLLSSALIVYRLHHIEVKTNCLPPTKKPQQQSHAPRASVSYLSVVAVLFSSRISRAICATVFSSTRKCSTVGVQSLGIPCGAFQLCLSDAVYHAGGVPAFVFLAIRSIIGVA